MPDPANSEIKSKKNISLLKFKSIQTKLTIVIILILVPIIALLSFLSYRNSKAVLESQIFELLESIANAKQDQIINEISSQLNTAKAISAQLASVDNIASTSGKIIFNTRNIGEVLQENLEENSFINSFKLVSVDNRIILSSELLSLEKPVIIPVEQIQSQVYNLSSDVLIKGLNQFNIYPLHNNFIISGPVKYEEATVAILLLHTNPSQILSLVNDYRGLGTTGDILLAKRYEDKALLLNQTRNQQTNAKVSIDISNNPRTPVALAVQQLSDTIITKDFQGREVLAAFRHLSLPDWGLVVKIESSEAYAPVNFLKNELIKISLLTLMLFMLVAFVVSRSITEPLHRLNIGTEKIAKGEWDYELNIKSGDEVEQLAEEFTHMAQELKGLYEGLENKVKERTSQLQQEKDLSEKLAQDLKKFQLAVENASDQIIITTPDASIIYANKIIQSNSGFSKEEVIGQNPAKLWGGQMENKYYQKMWETIKDKKQTFEGELTNKRKNGEEYIAYLSISPILSKENKIHFYVGIERDITIEKEIDRMKTEFISVASHQLRTPLSAIKWFTEMLLANDAGKLLEEQREYMQQVYDSNERMIELVNALLNVSRIEQGRISIEPEPTNLSKLINEVLTELTPRIKEKELEIVFNKKEDLPEISVDSKLIRQAYANLLTNAVKYTGKKGKIEINLKIEGENIISQVKDNGHGIPPDQQDKVFTKFFRADNIRKISPDGSGLGLYIVKSVVESSGGKIWFKSEEDKGTSFWFTLPVSGTRARKGERTLEEIKY